ncbi:MAG: metalloregulator ArsR/SmtB family transcription factor [Firmicutes bacterium]|nr:metalloregulator ArsR/SmtB family transcription factor [Bacillota bacterium]
MEEVERLQHYFQVLSDVNRLRIIKFIDKEKRSVSEIVKNSSMSQPLVSHHLKVLKNSHLVETQREGPFVFYQLTNPKILDILGLFEEMLPNENLVSDFSPMFCCPSWWGNSN